jgi:protein TonB
VSTHAPTPDSFSPDRRPAEVSGASVWSRKNAVAFATSTLVHVCLFGLLAGLNTEPPRMVYARTIDVTLVGGPGSAQPTPRAATAAADAADAHQPDTLAGASAKDDSDADGDHATVAARYDVAALSNPKPPYPLAARRRGIEGRVMLRAQVRADGSCAEVWVKRSSGHDVLDAAALDTVRRWRFVPAQRAGRAVDAWVEVPIVFRLEHNAA